MAWTHKPVHLVTSVVRIHCGSRSGAERCPYTWREPTRATTQQTGPLHPAEWRRICLLLGTERPGRRNTRPSAQRARRDSRQTWGNQTRTLRPELRPGGHEPLYTVVRILNRHSTVTPARPLPGRGPPHGATRPSCPRMRRTSPPWGGRRGASARQLARAVTPPASPPPGEPGNSPPPDGLGLLVRETDTDTPPNERWSPGRVLFQT